MVRREVGDDRERLANILSAVERYQAAPPHETVEEAEVIGREGAARLLHYGGSGQLIVFVPSLVNPPDILDLGERSLLRWLARKGFSVHMIDWGRPGAAERSLSLAGVVTERLVPLLGLLERPPILAGYCLGGTLAIAAAKRIPATALVTLATPWRLSAYPLQQRTEIADYWQSVRPLAEQAGFVSMDLLQPAFWALDPAQPVRKFERYAAMPPLSAEAKRFARMEDWANGGNPIPLPAVDELMRAFAEDRFASGWEVGGDPIDPLEVNLPWLDVHSATDRIVPAASAPPAPESLTVEAGHVGMVVGGRAETLLWKPMAAWLQSL